MDQRKSRLVEHAQLVERPQLRPPSSPVLQRRAGTTCPPGTGNHDDERLNRFVTSTGPATAPPQVHDVLSSSGTSLDPAVRGDMEARFGQDFSAIRVHSDSRAATSAAAVGALAYTVGPHVVLGSQAVTGERGRRILAHELVHTIQQGGTVHRRGARARELPVSRVTDPDEHEADRVADAALRQPARPDPPGERHAASLLPSRSPDMGLLDLRRRLGNSAVSHMVNRREGTTGRLALLQRQSRTAAPTGPDLSLQFQQQLGLATPDYNAAAVTLNGMSDADMEAELRAVSPAVQSLLFLGALRTMLMWPPPHRVTDTIHRLNVTASKDGLVAYFHESVTSSHWHEAAVALNGLSDTDIGTTIAAPPLATPQLVQLRDAARQHMAGWNTRVVTPIEALLQGATANELGGMVGSRATWIGSGPGSGNTFERWASAPTEGTAPPVQPSTRINCWEMVLLAAFRAGTINWRWIHDAYTATGVGRWATFMQNKLTPAGRQTYSRGNPAGPTPRRGDIVLWNGIDHVAMAVGGRDGAGRTQVYSFWPPPGTAFAAAGTEDAVKITTIEQLADYMDANGMSGGATVVQFGAGPW